MTDYTKLVEALRCASKVSTAFGKLMADAADAIEALQAEQKKTVTQIFGEEQQEWEEYCAGLMSRIRELKAQLPKHGEWIHIEGDDPWEWTCSVCMKKSEIHGEEPAFCPKCGADMRKMEAQDG